MSLCHSVETVKLFAETKVSFPPISGTSEPAVSVDATYKQDMVATQVIINQNATALGLNLNASFGMNNTTVGVTSALDLSGGNFSLKVGPCLPWLCIRSRC